MAYNEKNDTRFTVVDSGDLGAAIRTIGGLLGQFHGLELPQETVFRILRRAGLPVQAADDPSFPISIDQDLRILDGIMGLSLKQSSLIVNLFRILEDLPIQTFGLFGLALQTAPSVLAAVRVPMTYPQLNWGRSRMIVRRSRTEEQIVLELPRSRVSAINPNDFAALYTYALILDLIGTVGIISEILVDHRAITKVTVPFEKPSDWSALGATLSFPVQFQASNAAIILKSGVLAQRPKHAHELSYKATMKTLMREASMLAEDKQIAERVRRWLWAYSPPLKKPEIAELLGLSDRTLSRRLMEEGTSYNKLFASVQAERAENFLSDRNLTIGEVAHQLGYSDPAAFTRAFTAWNNISPLAWRAHAQN